MRNIVLGLAVAALVLAGGVANADPLEGDMGCHLSTPDLTPAGAVTIKKAIDGLHPQRSKFTVSGPLAYCGGGTSGGTHPHYPIVGGTFMAHGRTKKNPSCGPQAEPATPSHPATLKGKVVWKNSNDPSQVVGTSTVRLTSSGVDTSTYSPSIDLHYTGVAHGAFEGQPVELQLVSAESWAGTLYPSCSAGGWTGFSLGNEAPSGGPASFITVGDPDFTI